MRRDVGWTGVQAILISSVIASLVFGQTPGKERESEAVRKMAETAASKGEWSKAASLYQSAIAWEQGSAWAHRGLADVYRANGVWDKAANQFDAALAIDYADAATKRLASLSRQAFVEARAGVVRAETFRSMAEFPSSWLQDSAGQTRDLRFRPVTQASIMQRIPLQLAFPRDQFILESLPSAAIRQLEEVAALIGEVRPLKVEVEGHTCRCGSDEANVELGRQRAEAVREFLIARRAVPAGSVTSISFGSSRPVEFPGSPDLPAEVCERDPIHSQNSRIVIVVYGQTEAPAGRAPRFDVSFLSRRRGTRGYDLLSNGGQLHTGDEFKIRLHAETAGYAYVFHLGSSRTWAVLFPDKLAQSEPLSNPLELGQELSIPNSEAGFILTGGPGPEETYVYSRQEPDPVLEALVRSIQNGGLVRSIHDGPDVKLLLPPALAGLEAVKIQRPHTGPGGSNQTGNTGSPERTPIPEVGSQVAMKDLARADSLPPAPSAYVRFEHLK